ncbi:MAG: hypothetical protein P1V19_25430, partial [Gimesia sp.]|nr:hypothetical protein [Gimesia sp.]
SLLVPTVFKEPALYKAGRPDCTSGPSAASRKLTDRLSKVITSYCPACEIAGAAPCVSPRHQH